MRLMLAIWGSMVYASNAHAGADEQSIANLVDAHRQFAEGRSSEFQKVMSPDYIHVPPEGTITTAWRVTPPSSRNVAIRVEKLHIAVFGDLAVSSCLWHVNAGTSDHSSLVVQAFQRGDGWRAIATQIGGRDPWPGRIALEQVSPAKNPVDVEHAIRNTWALLLRALDFAHQRVDGLKTPTLCDPLSPTIANLSCSTAICSRANSDWRKVASSPQERLSAIEVDVQISISASA